MNRLDKAQRYYFSLRESTPQTPHSAVSLAAHSQVPSSFGIIHQSPLTAGCAHVVKVGGKKSSKPLLADMWNRTWCRSFHFRNNAGAGNI
jgi:hypothetical protein